MPGNGITGITFGPYFQNVNVAFRPSLAACTAATGHQLAEDGLALAAAIQSGYNQWQSSSGAQQMNNLLGSYAAGEIGAAAFIAGSIDILGVATVAILIAATALTIASLVSIAECVASGNAVGYVEPRFSHRLANA